MYFSTHRSANPNPEAPIHSDSCAKWIWLACLLCKLRLMHVKRTHRSANPNPEAPIHSESCVNWLRIPANKGFDPATHNSHVQCVHFGLGVTESKPLFTRTPVPTGFGYLVSFANYASLRVKCYCVLYGFSICPFLSLLPFSLTTRPPDYPTIRPPDHQTIQPSNHPTTRLPDYPTTRPPDYPTTRLSTVFPIRCIIHFCRFA